MESRYGRQPADDLVEGELRQLTLELAGGQLEDTTQAGHQPVEVNQGSGFKAEETSTSVDDPGRAFKAEGTLPRLANQ